MHAELVESIKIYIDNNYTDVNTNVYIISTEMGMSREHISKVFKEQTGDTVFDTIHKKRIDRAVLLLKEGKTVKDTARTIGYVNSSVFIRHFKKYCGMTPQQYKNMVNS